MSTQAHAATVREEITVEAPVERAFRVFTEQMDKIKPREHNASSPKVPSAPGSSSSIATSIATVTAGRACATASPRPTAGRYTCSATPIS